MGISFDEMTNKPKNNILIVDSLNLSFRWLHSNTTDFAVKLYTTIQSLATSYSADKVFVLGDWGSYYRDGIFPDYKKDRRDKRKKQTKEEEESFKEFLDEYHKGLELCSGEFKVIRFRGVEADDIAAYITKYADKDKYDHIWLISSDSDWDLLLNDRVSRFAYTSRKEFTIDTFEEHMGYPLNYHLSIKVLQGDKSDSIPGIPGIGAKRAYALIRQYGSAFDIYDALPLEGKQKFIQNLNTLGPKIILTNYELMDLLTYCDEALEGYHEELDKILEEVFNEM